MKGNEEKKRRDTKLVYVTTVPETIRAFLMGGHIDFMKSAGFEVICVSSPGEALDEVGRKNDVEVYGIEMTRRITPFSDLKSLLSLCFFFRRTKPEIVNLSTPKASFLSSIAAWAARVPVRIYMNRGTVFVNEMGLKRLVLKCVERLTSTLCHQTIFVSRSQMEFARRERTISKTDGIVLGHGMSNGIDTSRFDPENDEIKKKALRILKDLGIKKGRVGEMVLGFVGRLAEDKGIMELSTIWPRLKDRYPNLYLIIIGPREIKKPVHLKVLRELEIDPRVRIVGVVKDTVPYYRVIDVLLFPSHREGFPNVPMEAASMKIPVVAMSVIGCVDAVVDGETGFLVPKGDVDSLFNATVRLLDNPDLRRKFGEAGRERCIRDFSPEPIRKALVDEYRRLLKTRLLLLGWPNPFR